MPKRLRSFRLPMVSGSCTSSLCCTSKVVNWVQLPIESGKYSKWLPLKFKEARLVKFRNEFLLILVIKFPLRSNEVRLSKFLSASGYIDVRVMLLK
jgi:hypothetical protein